MSGLNSNNMEKMVPIYKNTLFILDNLEEAP